MAGFLDKFKSMVGMKPAAQPKNDPQELTSEANAVRKPITGSDTNLPCVEKTASAVNLPPVSTGSPSPDPQRPRKQSSTFVRLQALSASGTGASGPTAKVDANHPLTSLLDQLENKK